MAAKPSSPQLRRLERIAALADQSLHLNAVADPTATTLCNLDLPGGAPNFDYVLKRHRPPETETISLSRLENVGQGHRFCDEEYILGKGTYGTVKLMADKETGKRYAVKSLNKNIIAFTGMESQVQLEIRAQQTADHPHVVKCWNVVSDSENIYLILDYCKNGDLFRRLRSAPNRRLCEREAFRLFMQLISGLSHLHNLGLCHRDLKLENLLLDANNNLKIADFGWVARINGPNRNHNFCGTLDYLSPEMILGRGHDWRVDVWAVGILLYEILAGKPPFLSTRHFDLLHRVLNVKIHDEFDGPPTGVRRRRSCIKPDALAAIKQLLHPLPDMRIAFEDTLQLAWVQRMLTELYTDTLRLWRETAAPCRSESASSQGEIAEEHTPVAESCTSVPLSAVLSARSLKAMRAPSVRSRLQHKRSSTTESCFQWKEMSGRSAEIGVSACAKIDDERTIIGSAKAAAYDDIYITSTCDRRVLRMYHRSTDFSTRRKDFSPVCALLATETPVRAGSEADEDRRFARASKPRPTNTHSLQRRWVAPGLPSARPVARRGVSGMSSLSGSETQGSALVAATDGGFT